MTREELYTLIQLRGETILSVNARRIITDRQIYVSYTCGRGLPLEDRSFWDTLRWAPAWTVDQLTPQQVGEVFRLGEAA